MWRRPERSSWSPQRRLADDLLYALVGPVIALFGGLLAKDDLTGYPLTFGLGWFVLGVVIAAVRFALALRRTNQG